MTFWWGKSLLLQYCDDKILTNTALIKCALIHYFVSCLFLFFLLLFLLLQNIQSVFESSCPISIPNSMVVVWIVLSVSQVPLCTSSKNDQTVLRLFAPSSSSSRWGRCGCSQLWGNCVPVERYHFTRDTPHHGNIHPHIPSQPSMLARPHRPGSHQAWILA